MLKRTNHFRQSLTNFSQEVEHKGLRAAIQRRRLRKPSSSVLSRVEQPGKKDLPPSDGDTTTTTIVDHSSEADEKELSAVVYTLGDHMEHLHLQKDPTGNYYIDVTNQFSDTDMPNLVKDFLSPIPNSKLVSMYYGMETNSKQEEGSPGGELLTESLPVRTIAIRLRPDVMSAVVVDALLEACEVQPDVTTRVIQRLQGHFQCLVVPSVDDDLPFLLDANVCANRDGVFDRQLILRIFHAGVAASSPANQTAREKRQAAIERTNKEIQKITSLSRDMIVPINLQLRGASSFIQYLCKQQEQLQPTENPLNLPSTRDSPQASSAVFLDSYDPTFSVSLYKELKHVQPNRLFPSLNSKDWDLLQSSWTLLSSIWRCLMEHTCLFHTIVDVPMYDMEAGKAAGPALDLHYCSQIRQLSRDRMLSEVASSFNEIKTNLDNMEKGFQNFLTTLSRTRKRYQMAQIKSTTEPPPYLSLPSSIPPPGFAKLATMACKFAEAPADNPAALCDDAVLKVYKTFHSQDDHNARKHLKEANATVMARLVEIQEQQMNLLWEFERDKNTQEAARLFCKLGRTATNSKGRVDRWIKARVPLLDFEIIGGRCQITSTAILCINDGIFGKKCLLFDLKAVHFSILSPNCLAIVSNDTTKNTIHKLYTVQNLPNLVEFLTTLQTLQSVFDSNTPGQKLPRNSLTRNEPL